MFGTRGTKADWLNPLHPNPGRAFSQLGFLHIVAIDTSLVMNILQVSALKAFYNAKMRLIKESTK